MNQIKEDKVNILWLSDIHFQKDYQDDKYIKAYLETFINKVKELHEKSPIKYIILSGDLAYSGKRDDYNAFDRLLLKPIYNVLEKGTNTKPEVLTIPGNHDIIWDKIENFYHNNKNIFKDNKFSENRDSILKKGKDVFIGLFDDYSFFHKSNYKINSEKLKVSKNYEENSLYGYVIDSSREIIFVMINTSWFSFGDNNIKTVLKNSNFQKSNIDKLYRINSSMLELGNLIVGKELLLEDKILEAIDSNPHYLIITLMHHPQHWLDWEELHNEGIGGENFMNFYEILEKSDVLLTGHEHLPVYVKPIKINDGKTLHLQAGKFLEDNAIAFNKNRFSHNRFSVLEIDKKLGSIKEQRFLYKHDIKTWEGQDKYCFKHNFLKNKVSQTVKTPYSSRNIADSSLIHQFDIKMYLIGEKKISQENLIESFEIEYSDLYLKILTLELENSIRVYIFPFNNTSYKNIRSNNSSIVEKIYNIIERKDKLVIITIMCFDFLVQDDIYLVQEYIYNTSLLGKDTKESGTWDKKKRDYIYGKIVVQSDIYFDNFYNQSLLRYEKNEISIEKFLDIRFSNEIIPYWKLTQYQKAKG